MTEALQAALDGRQAQMWTGEPGIVKDVAQLGGKVYVSVQPSIQARLQNPDGSYTWITKPVIPICPVVFPGGGGFTLTFPIAIGDEGMIMFAHRCIDGWWQSGGVQQQIEMRMHDLTDGIFIPRLFSQPNIPAGIVNLTGPRLTKDDGTAYFEMTGQACNMVFPGGVTMTTPKLAVVGGEITATEDITAGKDGDDQVTLQGHTHAQDPDSNGDTEEETNPPTPNT